MANFDKLSKDDWWTSITKQNKWAPSERPEEQRKHRFFPKKVHYSLIFKKTDKSASTSQILDSGTKKAVRETKDVSSLPAPLIPKVSEGSSKGAKVCKEVHRRLVCLSGIPKGSSLAAVVSFVRGGALERVSNFFPRIPDFKERVERDSVPDLQVYLEFITHKGACRFLAYVNRTALLKITGQSISAQWAKEISRFKERPIEPHIDNEVKQYGASRVLILSHHIAGKTPVEKALKQKYPNPMENFSSFNCNALKVDFGQFGEIVEVLPMISPKLSVSIQFADIRSAIVVMNTVTKHNTVLNAKYSLWKVKYARDVTNKPCYSI